MMGEPLGRQDRLFYEFDLEDMVPGDHLLRRIDAALELSWLRSELTPYYTTEGLTSNPRVREHPQPQAVILALKAQSGA